MQLQHVSLHTADISPDTLKQLPAADALVFSCPLYVDGIPAHLLSCLVKLEELLSKSTHPENHAVRVYALVNCGFYEGIQAEYALQIFQNWCNKTGFHWSGGIGIGGGLSQMTVPKPGQGPKAPVDHALHELADIILTGKTIENKYVSVAFPRFLYKMAAQLGWRQMIRANGKRARNLGDRPSTENEASL